MTGSSLKVAGGGASKGAVGLVSDMFARETGLTVDGWFSAVGAVRDRLLAGDDFDVLILSRLLIDELTTAGALVKSSARALGGVPTGVAVPARAEPPDISTPAAFASALGRASAVYIPDPVLSTAGSYFTSVLERLGIRHEIAPRLRAFPNGETAMAQLARDGEPRAIGCTQLTEIRMTEGLTYIGPLPGDLAISTIYVAAVSTRTKHADAARRFVEMLTGADGAEARRALGFVG